MKSTAKATEKRSRTVVVLAIAVALMLLGSIFAQMFNTSFYKVKVSRISFDTDSGTLSGLLYMPKGVDVSNPHPTIVTTHGYLNSAEMQDETASRCPAAAMSCWHWICMTTAIPTGTPTIPGLLQLLAHFAVGCRTVHVQPGLRCQGCTGQRSDRGQRPLHGRLLLRDGHLSG